MAQMQSVSLFYRSADFNDQGGMVIALLISVQRCEMSK